MIVEEEEGKEGFGEDEEEEEGEGEGVGGRRAPIVLELPLCIQGYQLIDSKGPDGINNSVSCIPNIAVKNDIIITS